jgi:hypothetical protein
LRLTPFYGSGTKPGDDLIKSKIFVE